MIHKKELSLREGQFVMLDILIEFDRVCRENDLKYFLNLLSWYEKIAWFFIELLALWKLYKFEYFIAWQTSLQ